MPAIDPQPPFIIRLRKTVGTYGHDEHGRPWSSFHLSNGTAPCDVCGKDIGMGYSGHGRRWLGEARYYVCREHVIVKGADDE